MAPVDVRSGTPDAVYVIIRAVTKAQSRSETNSKLVNESFGGWTETFTDPRLRTAVASRPTFNGTIIETGHRLPPSRLHPDTSRGTCQGRPTASERPREARQPVGVGPEDRSLSPEQVVRHTTRAGHDLQVEPVEQLIG
ncbi:hypothetical protein GCM10010405_50610 [Streptomyces macrosporus]|uniref:Transposase n=1 Tax=Streptomyces macrosporus TaxID=44032 RepID=A0ABP5XMC3_9ACTN